MNIWFGACKIRLTGPKTFRPLVNHSNGSFFLNSNSPMLNTIYTSHLIFFGLIHVPKALFACLSRRRLSEAKRALGTRMFLATILLSPVDCCAQRISFGGLRSNAVNLFQTNSVIHWNAPDFFVLRDVHPKTLLSKRQKTSWVSRSTGKSSSTSAFKLGSFQTINK